MNKFKDILYNKNDILIAIGILIVAAAIIFWRIDVIMDYPKTLIAKEEIEEAGKVHDAAVAERENEAGEPADTTKPGTSSTNENNGIWTGDKLTSEITITIAGGSATSAVSSLVNVGIFESYEDYENTCLNNGYDPLAIKATQFTFPAGMTKAELTKTITQ